VSAVLLSLPVLVSTVLAHQGGWDEILFVLAPLVVFAVLLTMARRRVDRLEQSGTDDQGSELETEPTQPAKGRDGADQA